MYISDLSSFKRRANARRGFPKKTKELDICLYEKMIVAADLARIVDRFQGRLEKARLGPFLLNGDAVNMAESFLRCTSLTELDFSLELVDETDKVAIGQALAALPLRAIKISTHCTIIKPLLENPNSALYKVTLEDFGSSNEDLQQFLKACGASAALEVLIIRPANAVHFSAQQNAVGRLIRRTTSLRLLSIQDDYVHSDKEGATLMSLASLAHDLRYNQSLRRLTIQCKSWYTTPSMLEAEAAAFHDTFLAHNFALEELEISPRRIKVSEPPPPAIGGFSLWEKAQNHVTRIEFLLSLNLLGRGRLMGPSARPSLDSWLECMANSTDLSVTYYFLRNNPSLCQPNHAHGVDNANRPKRTLGTQLLAAVTASTKRPRQQDGW